MLYALACPFFKLTREPSQPLTKLSHSFPERSIIRVIQSCTYLLLIAYLLAYLFHHLFDKENNKESESKDNELD